MKKRQSVEIKSLPAAVEAALRAYLPSSEEAGAVIAGKQEGTVPLLPALVLERGKQQRLGSILRQVSLMLEEPFLYMDDFGIGSHIFSPQEKRLFLEEDEISLTDRETEVLCYLARRKASASREELLRDVWKYQDGVDTHTVETHIYRLRQKLDAESGLAGHLVTDDAGYRLKI